MTTLNTQIEAIASRAAAARAEFGTTEPDQSTRDIEYLLSLLRENNPRKAQVDALRGVASGLSWFGAQGNLIEPDTAWAGVSACISVLKDSADEIEAAL